MNATGLGDHLTQDQKRPDALWVAANPQTGVTYMRSDRQLRRLRLPSYWNPDVRLTNQTPVSKLSELGKTPYARSGVAVSVLPKSRVSAYIAARPSSVEELHWKNFEALGSEGRPEDKLRALMGPNGVAHSNVRNIPSNYQKYPFLRPVKSQNQIFAGMERGAMLQAPMTVARPYAPFTPPPSRGFKLPSRRAMGVGGLLATAGGFGLSKLFGDSPTAPAK